MTTGVLLMAHGTPARTAEIAPFYTRIRRGRPPTPEQLAELEGRYDAIGGVSPLAVRTAAQVDAVRAALEARDPGRYVVSFGAKHTDPLIEESAASAGRGRARTRHRPRPHAPRLVPGLAGVPGPRRCRARRHALRARAAVVRPAVAGRPPGRRASRTRSAPSPARAKVVFTAHSLPERIRETGDTYPEQLAESARLVAEAAGLEEWFVAWQSAGRTPEPWLGPDVRDLVRQFAADGRTDAVVVCPIGFVADHLEVLYDLDVELARRRGGERPRLRAHLVAQ